MMTMRKTNPAETGPAGPARAPALSVEHERALIDQSRRGDIAAFDQIVRIYEKQVYNLAYRLSGSYDDASDIAQEALVRAWNNLRSFRGEAAFSTWLYRIVTNVFLDERKRSRARREQRSLDDALALDESTVTRQFEDQGPGPQEIVEAGEQRALLDQAIATLPPAQRAIIVLYHAQQLSYEEIAEITRLPMGTVKSRLNRARLALKSRLAPLAELFYPEGRPL